MSGIIIVCDLCKKEIPNGAAYVGINYHIEQMDTDPIKLLPTVQVISAEQIITMCGKCGNKHQGAKIKEVLQKTLVSTQPIFN